MHLNFDVPYGNNESAGKYVELNGAKIYYETYGEGEPLLLIHANSGDIRSMGNQIDYFKSKYRVIVADSRGQGKSELKTDLLTYNQITKDWEALAQHLELDSLNILGWSDGGIVGLKMAISGKTKIKKLVTMAANLRSDTTAVNSWAIEHVKYMKSIIDSKIAENDTSTDWNLQNQLLGLMINQPNIPVSDLAKIKAQVLIMAGDKDIIKNAHSIEIFEHIPKAQLCIMPGETHFSPAANPKLFNEIANRFFTEPFKRPDSDWSKW